MRPQRSHWQASGHCRPSPHFGVLRRYTRSSTATWGGEEANTEVTEGIHRPLKTWPAYLVGLDHLFRNSTAENTPEAGPQLLTN